MSSRNVRTEAQIREEIAAEQKALGEAIQGLRGGFGRSPELRQQLPALALGAFVLGFAASGGIGATARTLMRKRVREREGRRGFRELGLRFY